MNDIVFIGSSSLGLKFLSKNPNFNVTDILCLKNRVNKKLIKLANYLKIKIKIFHWKNDFNDIITQYPKNYLFFIYQLDMIVPDVLTKKYRFFNLHRGSLYNNRGRNPEIRSILNGSNSTVLSLHKINEKIDSGILIDEYKIQISELDNTNTLKNKLERGIPKLVDSLYIYILGNLKGVKIINGTYFPPVKEEDFIINIKTDSLEIISRKIRSQSPYNGAILFHKGIKYYVEDFSFNDKMIKNSEKNLIFKKNKHTLKFQINLKPKYKSPPIFPNSKRV